ncbi:MAG: metallophosphoesterase [Clostridia bacterium]|nr:metallophosphoesterase [Clostridia bacterium]
MRKSIRIVLSTLIIICIAVSGLPVCAKAEEKPLKLTVAADTHFQCSDDLGAFSDEYTAHLLKPDLYGYASTQGQMNYESEAILAEMLAEFKESDSEYLLIAGDLTCGKRASHIAFAKYLHQTEQSSGKQIFVINGNHDCDAQSSENGITMEEFRDIYADFGYTEALSRHEESASYTADLNKSYRLLAIDSCIYGEDEGEINSSVFNWIKSQTEQAKKDNKTLIAMMHHSILPHYELQPMVNMWNFYAGWFADHGIKTVLTGHIHANDISSSVSDFGNTLYDIQTGALISSPNTYRVLTFNSNSIEVESKFIDRIDASLLPYMMTQEQRALLSADFQRYAKEYFVSGVGKWMNRNLGSPNRLVRWFKLKEGTKAYSGAEKLMSTIGNSIGQDIYGETDSIEAALAPFGVSVPESTYKKPYETAAKLMYGFFHGDEQTISSQEDVLLLEKCIEGAILTAARDLPDNEMLGELVFAVTGKTLTNTSMREMAENLAHAFLETLAGGIVDDYSDPADLNVSLPVTQPGKTVTLHILLRIFKIFNKIINKMLFQFI